MVLGYRTGYDRYSLSLFLISLAREDDMSIDDRVFAYCDVCRRHTPQDTYWDSASPNELIVTCLEHDRASYHVVKTPRPLTREMGELINALEAV